MSGCGRAMVGRVVVGEDGAVLGEDVKEVDSTDLHSAAQVMVGYSMGHGGNIYCSVHCHTLSYQCV